MSCHIPYCNLLDYTTLCHIILYYTVLYYTILCSTISYHTRLYYTVLQHVTCSAISARHLAASCLDRTMRHQLKADSERHVYIVYVCACKYVNK